MSYSFLMRPSQIPKQEKTEWCWAAVTNYIDLLFRGYYIRSQCDIAQLCKPGQCNLKCTDINCNEEYYLNKSLAKIGRFKSCENRPLTSQEVIAEIDSKRPVGVRIEWPKAVGSEDSKGHFVAIVGYLALNDGIYYHVYDPTPIHKYGAINHVHEDELKSQYKDTGIWSDSFFTG